MTDAGSAAGAAPQGDGPVGSGPVGVLISYAHDDEVHEERVRDFWLFLRANGVDATLDLLAAEQRQDWAQWTTRQVRDACRSCSRSSTPLGIAPNNVIIAAGEGSG